MRRLSCPGAALKNKQRCRIAVQRFADSVEPPHAMVDTPSVAKKRRQALLPAFFF
jgi:hypothetical protein